MSATQFATPDGRISLEARPRPRAAAGFELVLIGHAPGLHRASAARGLAGTIALAGFDHAADRLRGAADAPGALLGVPLPLQEAEGFARIFPEADTLPTVLGSRGAGRRAFLARAVRDAFRAGAGRVWVVALAEPPPGVAPGALFDSFGLGPAGFGSLARPDRLRGLGLALAIPDAALVGLPDLERLLIALEAAPADTPVRPLAAAAFRPNRPMPPVPGFALPPAVITHDPPKREEMGRMLAQLQMVLARWRPDMQALLTLPLGLGPAAERRGTAAEAIALLDAARAALDEAGQPLALDRLQLLHPLLRGTDGGIGSASGAVAGAIAAGAGRDGPWRSIAGRPLTVAAMPTLTHAPATVAALREAGLGVLTGQAGRLLLDDEAVPPGGPDGGTPGRPAEVVRFLGWLRRRLRRLGEALVFENLPDDGRTELALRGFLLELHAAGALRGATPEEAFRLVPLRLPEGAVGFEIGIAPALPVEAIRIRLLASPAGLSVEAELG